MKRPSATVTSVTGVPVGRQRDWIPVTTLSVPTVWLATAEGIVCLDLVAVELAANGLRSGWTLTSHEAAYAASLMFPRGVDRSTIAHRVGVSGSTLRTWFPEDRTPLPQALARIRVRPAAEKRRAARRQQAQCGTYSGSRRHQRQREPQCEACREARKAAEHYYRIHGTYVGAPGTAA